MTLKWLLCIFCPLSFGTMVLALECESYDQKCQASDSTATVNTTCSSLQRCDHTPGKVPACFALFGRNNHGELSVVKKGCVQNSTPNCRPSSVCSVQERGSPEASPSAFYCCCTEDRCNRDVILFVTEAKEKNSDIQESIRKLTLLIWAQFVIVAMVSSLTATAWFTHKIISVKRQRHSSHSLQTLGDRAAHRLNNRSHWARKDFELITCLLRSKFGEIWKARPHGSNQVVRIRLTAGSDDVYVYDRLIMTRETNDHVIRIV